jgi:hypothetical protein
MMEILSVLLDATRGRGHKKTLDIDIKNLSQLYSNQILKPVAAIFVGQIPG